MLATPPTSGNPKMISGARVLVLVIYFVGRTVGSAWTRGWLLSDTSIDR